MTVLVKNCSSKKFINGFENILRAHVDSNSE
jgi:hypothetical protein